MSLLDPVLRAKLEAQGIIARPLAMPIFKAPRKRDQAKQKRREADVLKACMEYLSARGVFHWRTNNIPAYSVKRKCYLSFHGIKGVADIIGILPPFRPSQFTEIRRGVMVAIETKRIGNKQSEDQIKFQERVELLGGVYVLAFGVDDVRRVLDGN